MKLNIMKQNIKLFLIETKDATDIGKVIIETENVPTKEIVKINES